MRGCAQHSLHLAVTHLAVTHLAVTLALDSHAKQGNGTKPASSGYTTSAPANRLRRPALQLANVTPLKIPGAQSAAATPGVDGR